MQEFLGEHYIIFIIISIFLIFSLIGYFVNEHNKKKDTFKIKGDNIDALNISSDVNNTNIANDIQNNMSINEIINKNVNK